MATDDVEGSWSCCSFDGDAGRYYDSSANNKWNPNPNKTVYYGEMTWEEMMFPFFGVVVGKDADTAGILQGGGFGRPGR